MTVRNDVSDGHSCGHLMRSRPCADRIDCARWPRETVSYNEVSFLVSPSLRGLAYGCCEWASGSDLGILSKPQKTTMNKRPWSEMNRRQFGGTVGVLLAGSGLPATAASQLAELAREVYLWGYPTVDLYNILYGQVLDLKSLEYKAPLRLR